MVAKKTVQSLNVFSGQLGIAYPYHETTPANTIPMRLGASRYFYFLQTIELLAQVFRKEKSR